MESFSGLPGIRVYDCDAEAKRLMRTDVRLQAGLKKLVGEQVYSAEGVLQTWDMHLLLA